MLSSTLRRPLVAAALLAALAGSQASAAPRADLAAGRFVADLSALPAAAHGSGVVAAGSDALSPAALESARAALTPGYLLAELHRDGGALRATLVYERGARGGVVVERTGTVSGDRVTFAPGAVVTGIVDDAAAAVAKTCPTCITSISMTPSSQTVNGLGYAGGSYTHQVSLTITGSAIVAAARDITVPFATCSAIQCTSQTSVPPQTGSSWHGFAPLGCDQTQTVHGWIEYDTGWKYASVSVSIDNPGC